MVADGLKEESSLLEERTQRVYLWQWISLATITVLALVSVFSVSYLLKFLDQEKLAEQLRHEQLLSRQRELDLLINVERSYLVNLRCSRPSKKIRPECNHIWMRLETLERLFRSFPML